jgi:hypothetical protein
VIELRVEGGRRDFAPGETLCGSVQWTGRDAPEALEVRLLWYTEGRGNRDVGVAQRLRIEAPAAIGSGAFRFDAPSGPWSCSGRLVSIRWALEAVTQPAGETARCELTLAPGGREIALAGGEP